MEDVAVVVDAAEDVVKPAAARQPRRQGSLRLRALAPGSIDVRAGGAGDGSAVSDYCHAAAAEVIPLLTPLHAVPAAPAASDQVSGGRTARHLTEVVAGGGRCVAVEKTRLPAWWWHPAMPPFVNDQPASASAVGFVFQNCV
uniref:Uncharacterized protein n=1 Tax=Oryza meridionalis TaxID=40149 RepID=A0A0E0DAU9_9ORYZ